MSPRNFIKIFIILGVASCSGSGSMSTDEDIEIGPQIVAADEANDVNIYAEDRASFCSLPVNDASTYWIEEFLSNRLNPEIFTFQESNGFCTQPGCSVGDTNYIKGGEITAPILHQL